MDPDSYLCRLADLFDGVVVTPPSVGAIIAIVLAVVLLFASGFVSASEIAFFSLAPNDLNDIEEENHSSDKYIKSLLKDSERLLATILISNNFVNVTIIMLCNFFFAEVIDFGSSVVLEFLVITVVLTFLLLLFGEIMPKIYSAQHTLKFVRIAAPIVRLLRKVFSPLSALLVRSGFIVNKLVAKKNYSISVDELSQALELTDKTEISEESNILEGIIRFGAETAKEVMTPRLDMVDLEINTPYSEVLNCVVENAYSRVPVYMDSRDNIKGILFGLGAATLYATVILLNKFTKTVDGIHRTFMQFISAIAVLVPYVLLTDGINLKMLDKKGWVFLLVIGIVHTGITYCLYFSSLKELPGQKAAILSYIDPLVAVLISVVVLHEKMTVMQIIGGLLILGFTLWNEISPKKQK